MTVSSLPGKSSTGREFQSPRADQSTSGQQREERFSRPQCHQGPQRAALG